MNEKIIKFLKKAIKEKGVKYKFISEKSNIEYQRLIRIFNQNATIRGSELISLSKILGVKQNELMSLIDDVA